MSAADQSAVDTLYTDKLNLLLNAMVVINNLRMAPSTSPGDATTLDAKYAALLGRLGILEKELTDVYSGSASIAAPDQATINAVEALATQVDVLNQGQAVASAVADLADHVLTAANTLAA